MLIWRGDNCMKLGISMKLHTIFNIVKNWSQDHVETT